MIDDEIGVQEERHLLDILAQIRRAHEAAAKPYVDRLIAIRSLRQPAPIVLNASKIAGLQIALQPAGNPRQS